jgi:hypothetical protein
MTGPGMSMRRHDEWDNSEDENSNVNWDDNDGEFDVEPTIPCPWCGREIHEDAPRCPYCERYLSDEDAPPPRKPWWVMVGTAACLYICYRWVFG